MEFDIVALIYSWKMDEAKKHMKEKLELDEIYVTDLVHCPLKYQFQKKYPDLALAGSFSPSALQGEFIHIGVEEVLKMLLGDESVKTEVEHERRVEVDGKAYIVKGRVDAVVGDYIVEIKSARSDAGIPYEHHVEQLRIYMWLTGLRKGILLYVTPARIVQFLYTDPASEGEVIDRIRSIINGSPAPRYTWECNYCPFASICPKKRT
jgi:CRISPR-associated exonuclease Cas4